MFKTILVGHDGSEAAGRVMSVAGELARRDEAKLVVANIDEHLVGKGANVSVKADQEEIRAGIEQEVEALRQDGVQAELETRDMFLGGPAHALMEIADESGADLIVVGSRGHSTITGLLLGSVTQRLLHIAKQPVMVVPAPS
jgi:nucleotide-binding universal stress UspA family protein